MDNETSNKLLELQEKVDKIYDSVEKTRKYFMWTMIITLAVLILPLIAMIFVVPSFISTYTGTLQNINY
jgi:type II secretory pathway component PulF